MLLSVHDAERKLVEMAESLKVDPVAWRAIHFPFSKLLEHYKKPEQIKIAVNIISDFVRDARGGVYILKDREIFVICKGVSKSALDKMIFQLRYLFMDDPHAYMADGQENPAFYKQYDLSVEWKAFRDDVDKTISGAGALDVKEDITDFNPPEKELRPMTPSRLSSLETDIAQADLTRVMRQQAICAVVPGNRKIKPMFHEYYINIAHLRKLVMSDVDLVSEPWLFNYLTMVLDDRMLTQLARRPTNFFDGPVSLNINVRTLLTDKFYAFDEAVRPHVKYSIVLEIQIADVFENMKAFLAAKQEMQKLGYRICLDGLSNLTFTQVSRERLGFDFAKLQWNPGFQLDINAEENKRIAKAVQECGPNRVILCRCDDRNAIDYGHAMGIHLFQGRHLDRILDPTAKVVN